MSEEIKKELEYLQLRMAVAKMDAYAAMARRGDIAAANAVLHFDGEAKWLINQIEKEK